MTNEEYLALESQILRSCKNIGLVLLDEPLFKAYIEETQRQRKGARDRVEGLETEVDNITVCGAIW